MELYYVGKDEKNEFRTIQAAVDRASAGDIIHIGQGTYHEKLVIKTDGLTLIGEDAASCVVQWADYALKEHVDGKRYGTFRTYTCLVQADDVTMTQLTIENAAGDGREVGQAIALYTDGDRLTFTECRLTGYQDTLFTAPLPPSPRIPGSFLGPSENLPYRKQRQYFKACTITGDVDYIFGSGLTLFDRCTMVTRNRGLEVNGYVTAPSTWEGMPYGYVFIDSTFRGEEGIDEGTVFLGRPWRPFGQVHLINCNFDGSIHKNLWDPWGKPETFKTATFRISEELETAFLDQWHKEKILQHAPYERE